MSSTLIAAKTNKICCSSAPVTIWRCCNHYKTLKISQDASVEEIKSAYFIMSKKCHPDKLGGNKENAKEFVEINEAYTVLVSKESRRKYDRYIRSATCVNRREGRRDGSRNVRYDTWTGFHDQQFYSNDPNCNEADYPNERLHKKFVQRLVIRSMLISFIMLFALYCEVFAKQFNRVKEKQVTTPSETDVKLGYLDNVKIDTGNRMKDK